jgi:TfoX/Sxy family transcriptional regulator of competence genes
MGTESVESVRIRARVEGALAGLDDVEVRRLFGDDAYFRKSGLFALLGRDGRVALRLPRTQEREALLKEEGTEARRVGSKALKHWVVCPADWSRSGEELRRWARLAHACAEGSASGAAGGAAKVRKADFPRLEKPKEADRSRKKK